MSVPGAWFGTVFGQIVDHDHLVVGEKGKFGFGVWCVCVSVCVLCVCMCVCVLLSVHLLE